MEPAPSTLDDRRLYEHAACGLVLTDQKGTIQRCNATFCAWVGRTADELVGMLRIQDLFTVGGRVFHHTHILPLLQMQGSVSEVQIELRHADRSSLPALINIFRRKEGEVIFDELAVFIATDRRAYERELLLARRNAEASLQALAKTQKALQEHRDELRRADRKKDEFLATLAHELRNPLAPMRNVLEVLKLKALEDPQLIQARAVFERQMQQMAHLVDDLMDVSRITQGRVELRRERLDIAVMMERAVEASAALIDAGAHQLRLTLPAKPLIVDADATRLTQILTNLLNNAAKYTPEGGSIWLEAEEDNGQVAVRVRDSGIGIPADHLVNVFNMFSQLEPALVRSQGGLGIGLALVKGLVALHGGVVEVFSEGAGMGSEFVVRLPLVAPDLVSDAGAAGPAAPEAEAAVPLAPGDERQRVLVVDDNRDAADVLAMALDLLGFTVMQHYDGASALAAGPSLLPHVAILDIGLPGMDGYAVARAIRDQPWGRDVLLVAATGWGQQRDKDAAATAGFDVHMVKPLDFEALGKIIRQHRAAGRVGRS